MGMGIGGAEDTRTCARGNMETYTHGHAGRTGHETHRYMGTYTHVHTDTWTHGHMDTWAHGHTGHMDIRDT